MSQTFFALLILAGVACLAGLAWLLAKGLKQFGAYLLMVVGAFCGAGLLWLIMTGVFFVMLTGRAVEDLAVLAALAGGALAGAAAAGVTFLARRPPDA